MRDKDGVNTAFIICEMFAYYKMRGISLIQKLEELYDTYGYCPNTLHSYEFPGSFGMEKMGEIMRSFHGGLDEIAGMPVTKTEDYGKGRNGLPPSDVLKFFFESDVDRIDDEVDRIGGSVVIRPSGTEPNRKCISA